jgi:hypothetical protein
MPIIPFPAHDQGVQLVKEINRRIRNLENASPMQAGVQITNGGLTMKGGGAFQILDAITQNIVTFIGKVSIPDGSGRTQMASFFSRDDGTVALALADLGTVLGHLHQQALQWFDRSGNTVVSDDTVSGQGLARPYIPLGVWADYLSFPTATTTSPTFVSLQALFGYKQHPKLNIAVTVHSSDSSTTGEVQVVDQDGNVLGGVQTVAGGEYQIVSIGPVALAGAHEQSIQLNIQARVTAGSGTIGVRGLQAVGVAS